MNDVTTLPFVQIQLGTYNNGVLLGYAVSFFSFMDGAYYCYCAFVLRISRYSDFLSPMLTNTGIFLRGLKISGEIKS